MNGHDAVVVGSGPNGLAAAITLAEAGRSVLVLEAAPTPGGGMRTDVWNASGARHDVCSTVHAFGAASPFFLAQPLQRLGVEWAYPPVPVAHPLDGGRAGVAHRDLATTLAGLGDDASRYDALVGGITRDWSKIAPAFLGPLLRVPRHPIALARFGLPALAPATVVAKALRTDEARALLAGCAAHAILPLSRPLTSSFGLVLLATAHTAGWPFARGGTQVLADALVARLVELGGEVRTSHLVRSLDDIPASARAVLFDTAPGQLASIAGDALPARYRRRLERFRHGPGAFKVDFELSGPVPWRNEACRSAGTVHVGGRFEEVAAAETEVAAGRHPVRPFVLVAQPGVADPTRAPAGTHVLWTYCHVPAGSDVDMTAAIEAQIERFAPGFRDLVRARRTINARGYEAYNPSYVGGDIAGGSHGGLQLLARPVAALHPYATPNPRLWLCSASTPPGGGVHGMAGWHAARRALATVLA
jgi:phytoene dehydrogenase-like protein